MPAMAFSVRAVSSTPSVEIKLAGELAQAIRMPSVIWSGVLVGECRWGSGRGHEFSCDRRLPSFGDAGQPVGRDGHGDGERAVGREADPDSPVLGDRRHDEREYERADAATGCRETDGLARLSILSPHIASH